MRIGNVEQKVREIEGFRVTIRSENGRDIRDDRSVVSTYNFERKAREEWTVDEWKEKRFKKEYAGFNVDVLYASGEEAVGHTKLRTVRKTYP